MSDPANQLTPMPQAGAIPDPAASQMEQILGVGAHPEALQPKIPARWQRFYDKLIQERDGRIDAATDLTQKAREVNPDPVQDSPAEVGTSNYHRDELLGTVTYDTELLTEINEAISRMENGTYGVCLLTGEQIPEARLEAVPWTKYTTKAQAEMEARGQTSEIAIGPLGGMKERGNAPAGPWRDKEGST